MNTAYTHMIFYYIMLNFVFRLIPDLLRLNFISHWAPIQTHFWESEKSLLLIMCFNQKCQDLFKWAWFSFPLRSFFCYDYQGIDYFRDYDPNIQSQYEPNEKNKFKITINSFFKYWNYLLFIKRVLFKRHAQQHTSLLYSTQGSWLSSRSNF